MQNRNEERLTMEKLGPGPLRRPKTRDTSHEQLVIEVKGIYAGLVLVEAKCMDVDARHTLFTSEDDAEQHRVKDDGWQSLIKLHKQLLYYHGDFFLASQYPNSSQNHYKPPKKYAMLVRLQKHGRHALLEGIKYRPPQSLGHMLSFIYLAYAMLALFYETVPACEDTWIEYLGDLSRYRMAIEDDKPKDWEAWIVIAWYSYSKASDRNPAVRRLYHHFAILARPCVLEQLSYYMHTLSGVASSALRVSDQKPTVGCLYHHLAILARLCVFEHLLYYVHTLSGVASSALIKENKATLIPADLIGREFLQRAHVLRPYIITADITGGRQSDEARNHCDYRLRVAPSPQPGINMTVLEKVQLVLVFGWVRNTLMTLSILVSFVLLKFSSLVDVGLQLLISASRCLQKLLGCRDHADTDVSALSSITHEQTGVPETKNQVFVGPYVLRRSTAKRYTPLRQLFLCFGSGWISTISSSTTCRWLFLPSCFWRLVTCASLTTSKVATNESPRDLFRTKLWGDSAVLMLSVIILGVAQMLVSLKRSPVPIWSTLMAAYAFAWWSIRSDETTSLVLTTGIFFTWAISSSLYARSAFEKLQAPSYIPLVVFGMAIAFDMLIVSYMTPTDRGISQADLLSLSLPSASTALSATAIALSTYRYKYGGNVRTEDRMLLQEMP